MIDKMQEAQARMTEAFDAAKRAPSPQAWQEARWAVDAYADACRVAGYNYGLGTAYSAQRAIDRHEALARPA
jgi:hypothetical protein